VSRLSVLLVAQLAPPLQITAAQRVAGIVKYLGRLDVEVTVLTSAVSGEGPIEGAVHVERTRDLLVSGLNWRRDQLQAIGDAQATYRGASRLESVVVPDVNVVGWVPFAIARARQLTRRRHFDCILTTSPPHASHLVGLALRRRGIPWIGEFRDGWTFDPPRHPWPTRAQRWLDAALERRVLEAVTAVVGVTRPITEDLAARYGVRAETLTNGFDPEERVEPELADGLVTPGRFTLVHTGRMSVVARDPGPLLDAIARLRHDEPALGERFELVLAGAVTAPERDALLGRSPDNAVSILGPLERGRALALQRRADALVVLARGISVRSVATGKLFEYLAAGRPVLVLGDETEAARIVEDTRTGIAVPANEPAAIADALRRLAVGPPLPEPDVEAVARYAYPEVAGRLAELIDEVSSGP
jgi:glycosyltransferase involved in cell wall biosynthesis